MACVHDGKRYCFYRDLDYFQDHLISLSPEDAPAIRQLARDISAVTPFPTPFSDLPGVRIDGPRTMPTHRMVLSMLPKLPRFASRSALSIGEYMSKFKSRGIRELFLNSTDEHFSTGAILFMLSSVVSGDFLFPIGGSQTILSGMVNRFNSLGGRLLLNTKATALEIVDGGVRRVSAGGQQFGAEAVIVSLDTRTIADVGLLGSRIREPWMGKLEDGTKPVIADLLSIGVRTPLKSVSYMTVFTLDAPLAPPYSPRPAIKVQNYSGLLPAPPGSATLTLAAHGDISLFDYWKAAKADGSYEAKKKKATDYLVKLVEGAIPEIRGKIVFTDLATPLTMDRYVGTWKGSYMSYFPPGWNVTAGVYPQKSKVVEGLYWAGARMQRPGGLPPALMTGRKAVQHICKDFDFTFR
jgi:phytoene dehydrogenase-like protein